MQALVLPLEKTQPLSIPICKMRWGGEGGGKVVLAPLDKVWHDKGFPPKAVLSSLRQSKAKKGERQKINKDPTHANHQRSNNRTTELVGPGMFLTQSVNSSLLVRQNHNRKIWAVGTMKH